jgi:hypothetical protein
MEQFHKVVLVFAHTNSLLLSGEGRKRHVDGGRPGSGVKGAYGEVPETPQLDQKEGDE